MSFFTTGHERSVKAKQHIVLSFLTRAVAMAIGLYLVPLTLRTVTNTEYGIWLTVASFLSWFSFFDIGLGNGLRNKLAEALAGNDQQRAREYISTTYAVLTAIALLLTVLFGMVYRYIPWREVFNAPAEVASDLTILVPVVFLLFMVQFVLQLIITVLLADQRPAITNLISLGGTVLTLGGVWAIQQLHQGSVLTLGVVFMLSPVIVLWCTHLYQYRTTYRNIAPAWRYVRTHLAASLTSIGGQFFVIQIAYVVLFSTSNMIIIHFFGPADVTAFNVAFKYFNLLTTVFVLVATPFWSAFTEAYHKNDMAWIQRSMTSLIRVWGGGSVLAIGMAYLAPAAFRLWLNDTVNVPVSVTVWMCIFAIVSNWNTMFAMFLNGTGKIRLQLYSAVLVSIINVPLSIGLLTYFGVSGVIMGTVACLGVSAVWSPIQYYKIINNTAKGIWGS